MMKKTIDQVLSQTTIDRMEAELLLAHVLLQPREFLIAHGEEPIGLFAHWKFGRLVKKRTKGWPIAYLTGHKAFYGREFEVNKHTLIPRPETELMVDLAAAKIEELRLKTNNISLIDVGTGSGCIPISILKTLQSQSSDCNLQSFATDISNKALTIAKQNAKTHGVEIAFLHGNLLEPIFPKYYIPNTTYIITANLPYLTNEQFETEASIQREPKSALVASEQGLALYRELLEQIGNSKLLTVHCYFEIDPSQSEGIKTLIHEYYPNTAIQIHKDLCGRDRIVSFEVDA